MPVFSNRLSTSSLSKSLSFRSRGTSSSTSDFASMGSGHSSASKYANPQPSRSSSNRNTVHNPPYPVSDSFGGDLPPPYTPTATALQTPFSPDSIQSSRRPRASASTATSRTRGQPSDDSEYEFLSDFDTIFVVDDSGSMYGRSWREAAAAIATITPICTMYDPDGIDIYFLNHRSGDRSGAYKNIRSDEMVLNTFSAVQPGGRTPVGRRLREILYPYLLRVERMVANTDEYGEVQDPTLVARPINVIVITDGAFSDDAESVIVEAARRLDKCQAIPWQVGIQFFQIGQDRQAQEYLERLDDDLGKRVQSEHVRDIVDTVPWKGQRGNTLSSEGILKVVLGAVNKKLDRQSIEP